jgi:hypothetical protein
MDVHAELNKAAELREATPGRPEDGPYPATIGEVADEVLTWIGEMERTSAPGLTRAVIAGLVRASINPGGGA